MNSFADLCFTTYLHIYHVWDLPPEVRALLAGVEVAVGLVRVRRLVRAGEVAPVVTPPVDNVINIICHIRAPPCRSRTAGGSPGARARRGGSCMRGRRTGPAACWCLARGGRGGPR